MKVRLEREPSREPKQGEVWETTDGIALYSPTRNHNWTVLAPGSGYPVGARLNTACRPVRFLGRLVFEC